MTITEKEMGEPPLRGLEVSDAMLERAHRAYERYGQRGDLRIARISDGQMRAVISAAFQGHAVPGSSNTDRGK